MDAIDQIYFNKEEASSCKFKISVVITRDEQSVYWKSVVWGFKPDLKFWNAVMDTFQEPGEVDVIFFPQNTLPKRLIL